MVSLASIAPEYSTNAATARPIQPSNCQPKAISNPAAISTAEVEIASLRLSAAVANSAVEEIFLPSIVLNADNPSFRITATTNTTTSGRVNATGAGCRILSMEDLPSSTPMTMISAATAKPDKYS